MIYLGDIAEDATIRGSFNSRKSDGTPITLAGTPSLAVYKDAGTTEITTGITLTVGFDSITGLHVYTIDTSASASYTPGSDYRVVVAVGTVDGISVVGAEVGSFSIQNRYASAKLATIEADTHELQTDWANNGRLDNILDARSSQTSVDDVPTNAELTTALGTGSWATAIPWNAAWDAEVQSECADALAAYDVATATALAVVAGYLDTEIAAILGSLPANLSALSIDALTGAVRIASDAFGNAFVISSFATSTDVLAIREKTDQFVFTVTNQVDANALTGGGGGGNGGPNARRIVVTVEDDDEVGVAGAMVHVLTDAEIATAQKPSTGIGGTAELLLDDGDYILRVVAPNGFIQPSDVEITVTDSESPVTVSLVSQPTVTPELPGMCVIRFSVLTAGAAPVSAATITAISLDGLATVDGSVITNIAATATTNGSGYAEIQLPRSSEMTGSGQKRFRFTIVKSSISLYREVERRVPDAGSAWFEDMVVGHL